MSFYNMFEFFPNLGYCGKNGWEAKMMSSIKEERLNDFQRQILELVLKKDWDKTQYVKFKTGLTKIRGKDMRYCTNTILKLLSTNDDYILEKLQDFSRMQDFYPFNEKKEDKVTGEYIREEKEINAVDCFSIVAEITKRVRSYASTIANNFLTEQDDAYACMDIIAEVLEGKDEKTKEKFFELFDKAFGYLKGNDLFIEIYNEYRTNFLDVLLSALSFRIARIRTGTNKNIDAYLYIKEKRTKIRELSS